MAVALGNVALLVDVTSPRIVVQDHRRPRPLPTDVILNLFKKDHLHQVVSTNMHTSLASKSFESEKGARSQRLGNRGKANSKVNAVDFEGSSDDDSNGNGYEEEEEAFDWEKEMRNRVKEIEEIRELEKKAEELQSRLNDGGEEGKEETEEEKRMRVRKELEKVAKEQAERRKTAQLMFELGQRAYGKGMYGRAIEFLEGALTIIARPTLFGGEVGWVPKKNEFLLGDFVRSWTHVIPMYGSGCQIQIWLAMAYEANNRHADCIALYQQLEKKHPSVSIRRQAADLRYILQAPKLKITQEEMVNIPLIGSSYDSYAATWSDKYKDKGQKRSGSTTNQLPSNRDYLVGFLVWRPPVGLEKSRAFWVALTLWLCLAGAAIFIQR